MSSVSRARRYALKGRRNALSLVYVGLCALQMAILASGLALAYRMEKSYTAQIDYGATLNTYQRAITEMRLLADDAAAPAADVTPSGWEEEWSRIQNASNLFIDREQKLQKECALASCREYLESLSSEMEQLVQQSSQAGQALRAGDKLMVRTHLFYALAQDFGHVATANTSFYLYAHIALKVRHALCGVANKFSLPALVDIGAARPPELDIRSDVGKPEARAKFLGQTHRPGDGSAAVGPEINCAQDVADRKLPGWQFFQVSPGPNRAFRFSRDSRGYRTEEKLVKGDAMGSHHDEVRFFVLSRSQNLLRGVAFDHHTVDG